MQFSLLILLAEIITRKTFIIAFLTISVIFHILAEKSRSQIGKEASEASIFRPFPKKEYYTGNGWTYKKLAYYVPALGALIYLIFLYYEQVSSDHAI